MLWLATYFLVDGLINQQCFALIRYIQHFARSSCTTFEAILNENLPKEEPLFWYEFCSHSWQICCSTTLFGQTNTWYRLLFIKMNNKFWTKTNPIFESECKGYLHSDNLFPLLFVSRDMTELHSRVMKRQIRFHQLTFFLLIKPLHFITKIRERKSEE